MHVHFGHEAVDIGPLLLLHPRTVVRKQGLIGIVIRGCVVDEGEGHEVACQQEGRILETRASHGLEGREMHEFPQPPVRCDAEGEECGEGGGDRDGGGE